MVVPIYGIYMCLYNLAYLQEPVVVFPVFPL